MMARRASREGCLVSGGGIPIRSVMLRQGMSTAVP